MSELFTENERKLNKEQEPRNIESTIPLDNVLPIENNAEKPAKRYKFTKKKITICSIIIVMAIVVIIAVAFAFLHMSKFERVKNKCVEIAGVVTAGVDGDYFVIETRPNIPDSQEGTLKAIQYANKALGFNGSVYSQMMSTTALMGWQSSENAKYRVTWTYHPDSGLEVIYEKK